MTIFIKGIDNSLYSRMIFLITEIDCPICTIETGGFSRFIYSFSFEVCHKKHPLVRGLRALAVARTL